MPYGSGACPVLRRRTLTALLAGSLFSPACLPAPPAATSAAVPATATATAWLNLLHYRPNGNGHHRSDVPDGHFFVSATGRHDPQAELQASLDRLHGPPADARRFACAFPARTRWLEAQSGLTATPGSRDCPELARWKAEIGARGVTLLFASAYMGSPSSMFGHTLLRFDSDRPALLSYAVNFAARVPAEDRLSYPFKGLTGHYMGQFSVLPYYQKLREYQHLEQRPMWEYRLPLTAAQTETLVDHIWELKNVSFPYYFLDENCGSRMLDVLGVIEPYARLTHTSSPIVVPQDVFKAIVAEGAERGTVHLVSARAELIAAADAGIAAPHAGHASRQIEAGAGRATRGRDHADAVSFTLAGGYHNLLDPADGYPPGAGIDFFRLGLRGARGSLRVESADLVDIQSLQTPAGDGWSPVWRAGLGLSRRHVPHSLVRDALSLQSHFGAGYGRQVGPVMIHGLLELRLAGTPHSATLGLGPRLGFAYQGYSGIALTGAASRQTFVDGGRTVDSMEIAAGLPLDRDHTLVGQLLQTRGDGFPAVRSLMLGLRRYF